MSLSRRSLSMLPAIRRARTAPRKLTSTIRNRSPGSIQSHFIKARMRRRRTSGGRSPTTTAAERRHSNHSSPAGLEHRKKSHPSDDSFFYLFESTRRDSNPRPSPWQGDTPPLSHSCTTYLQNHILKSIFTVSSTNQTFLDKPSTD